MLAATLGGLIKDYRIKKRLSQLEVSMQIGWSDTTRLSKIEQGRVGKPSRETIEKIMAALKLDNQEKGEFLWTGGYPPNDEEIKKIIKEFNRRVLDWPYPAHLTDFSGRLLLMNDIEIKEIGASKAFVNEVNQNHPNTLEMAFNLRPLWESQVQKGDSRNELIDYRAAKIAKFKTEQLGRENDSWYKQLINKLSKIEDFRRLWVQTRPQDYERHLKDYEVKEISSHKKKRYYHAFTTRLVMDSRFQIVFHVPIL